MNYGFFNYLDIDKRSNSCYNLITFLTELISSLHELKHWTYLLKEGFPLRTLAAAGSPCS